MPPTCPRCADPYAGLGEASFDARDLRDRSGRLGLVAEILSSGEPAVVLGSEVNRHLAHFGHDLPFMQLGVTGVDCVSRHCWRTRMAGLRADALLFIDWDAAQRRPELVLSRRHVIVADPLYSPTHSQLLKQAAESGARVHLIYGDEDRAATERELGVRVHPRHWMVALYRELQKGHADDDGLFAAVLEASWTKDGLMPTADDLREALGLLEAIGHASNGDEKATIKASEHPSYAVADAAFERAVRLCRKM